jgi:hypothetical protein
MPHYLEVHITIKPLFEENLERIKTIASEFNFKVYRYKLETVPLDSRYADTLQLLS